MTPRTQKVIDRIQQEHIRPIPRWYFFFKRLFWWVSMATSLLLAICITALSFHLIFEMEWYSLISKDLGVETWLVLLVPVFWIIVLSGSILFSTYCFRKTKRGYRYTIFSLATIFIAISISFALALEFSPLDNPLEKAFLYLASPQGLLRDSLQ